MDIYKIRFFTGIEEKGIKEIEAASTEEIFEQGTVLFEKGSPADSLFILKQGSVDMLIKGNELNICNLVEPGEVFGWSSIVEKGIYTSSCICKTRTQVLKISKGKIEDIFNRYPKAAITFYRRLGSIFSKRLSKAIEETV